VVAELEGALGVRQHGLEQPPLGGTEARHALWPVLPIGIAPASPSCAAVPTT
jgi:hypothetical protein